MAGVKIAAAASGGSAEIAGPPSSSANTVLKLPADTGSAGQVLKVKSANHSSTNAELEWAADAGGKILQVVASTPTTTELSTNESNNLIDTGLSQAITPTATTSHFIIHVSHQIAITYGSGTSAGIDISLLRDKPSANTTIFAGMDNGSGPTEFFWQPGGGNPDWMSMRYNVTWYDDPNLSNLNAVTYKTRARLQDGSATLYINKDADVDGKSWMIIYEVAAS